MAAAVIKIAFVSLLVCGAYSMFLNSDPVAPEEKQLLSFEDRERALAAELLRLSLENATVAQLLAEFEMGDGAVTANKFECEVIPRSSERPTSVHRLTPGDIDVVAALGDSLTAGRAIKDGVIGLLFDYRELSWDIGGEAHYEQVATVPNLLKKYNNDITGYAVKFTPNLNVAKSGAKSDQMYDQAVNLVEQLKTRPSFNEDWKLITIFIGGNDLCDWCTNETKFTAEAFKGNVERALDYINDNVPKAYVNVVNIFKIEALNLVSKGLVCNIAHIFICDCIATPKPGQLEKLIKLRAEYQNAVRELASLPKYQNRKDFTVELQPFYEQTELPRKGDSQIDYSYFAADCFHFSKKGHAAAAEALWSNMFEPVNAKRLSWHTGEKIVCPTRAFPYLYTKKNSFGIFE